MLVDLLSLFEVFGLCSGVFIGECVLWDWSKTRSKHLAICEEMYCIKWERSSLDHILRAITET